MCVCVCSHIEITKDKGIHDRRMINKQENDKQAEEVESWWERISFKHGYVDELELKFFKGSEFSFRKV